MFGYDAQRAADSGRVYYEFEFASKAPNYIRHALSAVTVANGAHPGSQIFPFLCSPGSDHSSWGQVLDTSLPPATPPLPRPALRLSIVFLLPFAMGRD